MANARTCFFVSDRDIAATLAFVYGVPEKKPLEKPQTTTPEDRMTLHERLDRLDRFAASLSELHMHHVAEAERLGDMILECSALREMILMHDGGPAAEQARDAIRAPESPRRAALHRLPGYTQLG